MSTGSYYTFTTKLFTCRPAICIFYLVLRALDTVEDDMTIPREEKVELLQQFHTNLYKPDWNYTESNEKDKAVLEDFPKVNLIFVKLLINVVDY